MRRVLGFLAAGLILAGCGGAAVPPTPLPTLGPVLSAPPAGGAQADVMQARGLPATVAPTAVLLATVAPGLPGGSPTPGATAAPAGGDPQTQYRRWMEEARTKHPYAASVDAMWHVMMCESSGNPTIQGAGDLTGLFQYQPSTWSGAWNPYRDQPITDARAQIFATAKAWSDGYQQWWGVCLP